MRRSPLALLGIAAACSSTPEVRESPAIAFSLDATIPAHGETYRCQFVRMPPSAAPVFVTGGQHHLSPGTHHYLLFRTNLTELTAEQEQQTDCVEHDGAMRYVSAFVSGGQTPAESADFPAGAALSFKPNEILLLQAHLLNPEPAPLDASVQVLFRTSPAAAIEQSAGMLQFYDPFIVVPPRSSASATMRCPIAHDITLVSAGPHMHKRGVHYEAYLDLPNAPPSTTPFYTSDDWEHPTYLLGYQRIAAGSTIRFRCDYRNDSDQPAFQGLSAEHDEMCMFGGYYYPAMQPEDELCYGMDRHGTGTASCAATRACIDKCPADARPKLGPGNAAVSACWQTCIAASCPNVTGALFPEVRCTDAKPKSDCAAEIAACEALACDR